MDLAAGHVVDARARLEARVAAAPRDVRLAIMAADVARAAHDPAAAETELKRAIAIDPSSIMAYSALGQLHLSQGRLADARADLQQIVARQPRSSAANTMVGMLLEAEGKPADAERSYEAALAADPRAATAANNLAWLYVESNRNIDQALQLAQTAKEVMPEDASVADTLGWIYLRKDLVPQALAALKQSVERDPTSPLAQYHLGLAQLKNGNRAAARQALKQALTSGSSFSGDADARRLLATLAE
jgi:tetratricopeptide (TPR) repeat protein